MDEAPFHRWGILGLAVTQLAPFRQQLGIGPLQISQWFPSVIYLPSVDPAYSKARPEATETRPCALGLLMFDRDGDKRQRQKEGRGSSDKPPRASTSCSREELTSEMDSLTHIKPGEKEASPPPLPPPAQHFSHAGLAARETQPVAQSPGNTIPCVPKSGQWAKEEGGDTSQQLKPRPEGSRWTCRIPEKGKVTEAGRGTP